MAGVSLTMGGGSVNVLFGAVGGVALFAFGMWLIGVADRIEKGGIAEASSNEGRGSDVGAARGGDGGVQYCSNCGAGLSGGDSFCPSCGESVEV